MKCWLKIGIMRQQHNNYSCLTSAAVLEVVVSSQRLKLLLENPAVILMTIFPLSCPKWRFPEFPSVALLNLLHLLPCMDNSYFWNTITPLCTLSCWDAQKSDWEQTAWFLPAYLWNCVLNFQGYAMLVMNLDSTNTIEHPKTLTRQAEMAKSALGAA